MLCLYTEQHLNIACLQPTQQEPGTCGNIILMKPGTTAAQCLLHCLWSKNTEGVRKVASCTLSAKRVIRMEPGPEKWTARAIGDPDSNHTSLFTPQIGP